MSKNNDNTVTKRNELEIQINDFTKGNQIEILQNISSHYWNGFANRKLKLVISITVIQIVFQLQHKFIECILEYYSVLADGIQ